MVVGGGRHVEDNLAAADQFAVGEKDFVEGLAVEFGAVDVRMLRAVVLGGDGEGLACAGSVSVARSKSGLPMQ